MDADDIKSVGKKAAEVVGNAAKYVYENPVETMKMFTPIGDIEDGLDPNKSSANGSHRWVRLCLMQLRP